MSIGTMFAGPKATTKQTVDTQICVYWYNVCRPQGNNKTNSGHTDMCLLVQCLQAPRQQQNKQWTHRYVSIGTMFAGPKATTKQTVDTQICVYWYNVCSPRQQQNKQWTHRYVSIGTMFAGPKTTTKQTVDTQTLSIGTMFAGPKATTKQTVETQICKCCNTYKNLKYTESPPKNGSLPTKTTTSLP